LCYIISLYKAIIIKKHKHGEDKLSSVITVHRTMTLIILLSPTFNYCDSIFLSRLQPNWRSLAESPTKNNRCFSVVEMSAPVCIPKIISCTIININQNMFYIIAAAAELNWFIS